MGFLPSLRFKILAMASVTAFPVLFFTGLTQAYLENTSTTVKRYQYPRLYLAMLITSIRSAVHCSSIPNTITGNVGNRRRLGLCNVYPKSRCKTSRARWTVIPLALANRVRPPRLPGLRGSRYRATNVPVESVFFFLEDFFLFIAPIVCTRSLSTDRNDDLSRLSTFQMNEVDVSTTRYTPQTASRLR